MNYFAALKIYNQGKGSYCSPKKGTPEHAAVLAIQRGGAAPAPSVAVAAMGSAMPPMPSKARIAELKAKGRALIAQRKADALAAMPKPKPPSATGVKMRRSRKTGSEVKLAIQKATDVSDPADPTGGGRGGLGIRMPRRKVKIAIPVADRPLPTTEFSRRAAPTTQFSSRSGQVQTIEFSTRTAAPSIPNMPTTQFSARSGTTSTTSVFSQPTATEEALPPSRGRMRLTDAIEGASATNIQNAIRARMARKELKERKAASTINNAMRNFLARSTARGRPAAQAREVKARADKAAYNKKLSKADALLSRLERGY